MAREVAAAVERTAALLADAGHEVRPDDPPYPLSLGWRFSRRWLPGIADDAAALVPDAATALEGRTRAMARAGRWLERRGLAKPAADDPFGPHMARWFGKYDLLLMPTLASTAVPIGRWSGKHWAPTTLGVANWICTTPWNLAGLPALSIPAGLAPDGLPLAVQLVGPSGAERLLLSVAAQIEAARPWPRWGRPASVGGAGRAG